MPKRPKVLLIAEAANPKLTSVALIGYSLANALREVADVHLVTELRNYDALLEAGFPADQLTAIDNRKVQGTAFRAAKLLRGGESLGWTIYSAFYNFAYPLFERKLWRAFKARLQGGEFELVHRITPLSPTTASPLAKHLQRIGVPFVIGPLNGGVPWPKGFDAMRRQEREWLSYVRGLYKLTPGLKATREKASALLLASGHTYHEVATAETLRAKAFYLPENAIDPARFPDRSVTTLDADTLPIRVAFVGRLVPYKGAVTLLKAALPLLKDGRVHLDIIGDGAQMPQLRELVNQHGLENVVQLPGWIPHEQLHERLSQAQVFGFPSVREFGGGVVLEAMALGLAPIIADYAGPAELLPEDCGIRVPFTHEASLENGFRDALTELANDPVHVREMGMRARTYCREKLTWPAKAQQLAQIYQWALAPATDKPGFGFAYEQELLP